jgi:hypothetical protein
MALMTRNVRSRRALGRAALALGIVGAVAGGVTGVSPANAATPNASGACASGYFCIYSGQNQTGSKCSYNTTVAYADTECSWMKSGNAPALSDSNKTGQTVTFYQAENFNNRIGSSAPGGAGNFSAPWHIGSVYIP